jgi:phthiocerol/phenolphthiocerol synthesis type-I polyketide synthase E
MMTTGVSEAEKAPGIAIIGLSGRFPGADSPDALWSLLREGREGIVRLDENDLVAAGVTETVINDPAYVRATAKLDAPENFDAAFFDIPPAEAEVLDPQQRVFLECAYAALEDAGLPVGEIKQLVGVYAGIGFSTYLLANAQELLRRADGNIFEALIGTDKDFLCTRVSYLLNLTGPSMTIQTACSSSLVAVHTAAQALLSGECDVALAGGVSIAFPHGAGYLYREGGILSPDGHCRPFDADAAGTVGGSGVGVVVLKRLENALADGDRIRAVIRGTAINNDGRHKISFTAPLSSSQAEVVRDCLAVAGVVPSDIDYVECHGTGTALGDPIEIDALNQAFDLNRGDHRCLIGSLKSNIGHIDTAAGVAGLIKLVLSLENELLPASLNYATANPRIPFDNGPFAVNDKATPWLRRADRARLAGLSSFGIGGTNAHVIVEEAPRARPSERDLRQVQIIPLSAKTETALRALSYQVAGALEANPDANALADTAYSLATGRHQMRRRRAVVAATSGEAVEAMRQDGGGEIAVSTEAVFLFPGQGAQTPRCGAMLYRTEQVFRSAIDDCLDAAADFDLRHLLFEGDEAILRQTRHAQPAIFAISYALAKLWESVGIVPSAMIGHSLGEYVAACLAGVFTLPDALQLVAARGALMQDMPPGAMLAAAVGEDEILALLDGSVNLAAVNAPRQCVLSGSFDAIGLVAAKLEARDVAVQRLRTSHAFHSAMMDPVCDSFRNICAETPMQIPQRAFISNVSGDWITNQQATSPDYWARHIGATVRFRTGIEQMQKTHPGALLIEVGPGRGLAGLARQAGGRALCTLPSSIDEPREFATALAECWRAGLSVDWNTYHGHGRRRVKLPPYPFERQRYLISPPATAIAEHVRYIPTAPAAAGQVSSNADAGPVVGQASLTDVEQRVRRLWNETLGIADIDPDSDFLALGGSSLMAIKLVRRLNAAFATALPIREIMANGTIRKQAALIGEWTMAAHAG